VMIGETGPLALRWWVTIGQAAEGDRDGMGTLGEWIGVDWRGLAVVVVLGKEGRFGGKALQQRRKEAPVT